MRPIPLKIRKIYNDNPFSKKCIHRFFETETGPPTLEHAFIYAGRQINEPWALVPCELRFNAGVTGWRKNWNKYVALSRVPLEVLERDYPRKNWSQELAKLREEFKDFGPVLEKVLENDTIKHEHYLNPC